MSIETEHNHLASLHENRLRTSGAEDEEGPDSESRERKKPPETTIWVLVTSAVTILWLLGLVANLLVPVVLTLVINAGVLLLLWLWAKTSGLNMPSFSSSAGKFAKLAGATDGGETAISKIEKSIPGTDLLPILAGAVTPVAYVIALWWNNR